MQIVRFAIVGASNSLLFAGLAAAFIDLALLQPAMANALAYVICTVCSFALNTIWSFSSAFSRTALLRFSAVSLLGLVLTTAIAQGVHALGGHYVIGIAAVILIVTPLTFALHRFWTYR
jgi:putative flippase GtrA